MTKAKLFTTGGSQAVRLPAEFRFEGSEVDIRRDPVTGEVVLSKPMRSWDDYFDWVRTLDLPDDFLEKRDQPKPRGFDLFENRHRFVRSCTSHSLSPIPAVLGRVKPYIGQPWPIQELYQASDR